MKYLLKIMLLSILVIPFIIWEVLVCIWIFRTAKLKQLWNDYSETVGSIYRKGFPRKPFTTTTKTI